MKERADRPSLRAAPTSALAPRGASADPFPPGSDPLEAARAVDVGPLPIGAYLADQRRMRGISLEALARDTRLPIRSLERLEAGAYDGDADGFVRGFVRTVAEALGLDAEETVTRILSEPDPGGYRARPRLSLRRVFLSVAVVVLLVAIAGLVQTFAITDSGGQQSDTPTVLRRDPVRALADAQGVAGLRPRTPLVVSAVPPGVPAPIRHRDGRIVLPEAR